MKWILTVIAFFCAGIAVGLSGAVPDAWLTSDVSTIILYILIIQVGLGIGMSDSIGKIFKSLDLSVLLVPVATVAGSLAFAALLSVVLNGFSAPSAWHLEAVSDITRCRPCSYRK